MARPLKQWLYKHRDNPYPTKTEKILLALGSQMTLVQVSNWFANARRRLKNTVRQPDLSWALRIKLYNKYVQGNAERLSVSSDDTCSEETVEHGSSKCDKSVCSQLTTSFHTADSPYSHLRATASEDNTALGPQHASPGALSGTCVIRAIATFEPSRPTELCFLV
ncbi:UNVERIFIED_CONTAM: hypothetical protein FKN15_066906 [Acipenser sinensis]